MEIQEKIAAGLERAFVRHGFAEPSVDVLREAADVSLRTLYKYTPSRPDMVLAALKHRHARFLERTYDELPTDPALALDTILTRIADWMAEEASNGCLFHAAVAAAPHDEALRDMLARHKEDSAEMAVKATGLCGAEVELTLLMDGLMQSWPLHGDSATQAAKAFGRQLLANLA